VGSTRKKKKPVKSWLASALPSQHPFGPQQLQQQIDLFIR